ncbi:complex I subunit 5 family protein [Halochromatium sp.]
MLGPLPALVAVFTLPLDTRLDLPWLFLGTSLGLDALARVYLLFTAILWLAAGLYTAFTFRGTAHAGRFRTIFLLAMAGNLWLIVGQDLFSFYAGFAIMGLAAYGLVIHDGSPTALRAGKVYLIMALVGEISLFAALVFIAQQTGTTLPTPEDLTQLSGLPIALLVIGLGVKAGLVPLHLWLPLAHPAAPIPASALLSGAMIKVAMLGWLRFLPVGATALPDWGGLFAAGGLLTLFYALPTGLVQSDPKVILAYSSISKMGLLMLSLGLVLMEPALAPIGVAAIGLYAAQHGLVKGGLFLGVGLRKQAAPLMVQPLVLAGLILLALALAGAPLTSGAVAKYELKPVFNAAEWPWVAAAVVVGSVATSLLMARFIWACVRAQPHPAGSDQASYLWPGAAWTLLIALVLLFPFVLGKPVSWLSGWLPILLGFAFAGMVAIGAWRNPDWLRPVIGLIPPGDLIVLAQPINRLAVAGWQSVWQPIDAARVRVTNAAVRGFEKVFARPETDSERGLRQWPVAGGIWLGIILMLLIALLGNSSISQQASPTTPDETPADESPKQQ